MLSSDIFTSIITICGNAKTKSCRWTFHAGRNVRPLPTCGRWISSTRLQCDQVGIPKWCVVLHLAAWRDDFDGEWKVSVSRNRYAMANDTCQYSYYIHYCFWYFDRQYIALTVLRIVLCSERKLHIKLQQFFAINVLRNARHSLLILINYQRDYC